MILNKARQYRRMIERAAALQDDKEALETVWMFPTWVTNHEYTAGERIRYNDTLYKCIQAHTSQVGWEPGISTSALWMQVSVEEYPAWIQPFGSEDAYHLGDKVTHKDRRWVSTFSGANIWEPSVYGWDPVE